MNTALHKITIYRDDSTTPVVFEDVKHIFWTANNTVFVIAQVSDKATGRHHYIHWPRERFCWFRHERQDGREIVQAAPSHIPSDRFPGEGGRLPNDPTGGAS